MSTDALPSLDRSTLRERALVAQSADIDIVSGATWTSQAYQQSLQSALVKAGRA